MEIRSEHEKLSVRHESYGSLQEQGHKKRRWSKKVVFGATAMILILGLMTGGVIYYETARNVLSDEPLNAVPRYRSLNQAYNLFRGEYFSTYIGIEIGRFRIPQGNNPNDRTQLGSRNYLVPKMLQVTEDQRCKLHTLSDAVTQTASTSDMKQTAKSMTFGYDDTTTVDVSVPVGPAEVGASKDVRTALLFGNSEGMTQSQSWAKNDYSFRAEATYEARAFVVDVRWNSASMGTFNFHPEFVNALQQVGQYTTAADRNQRVFKFFNDFGSHVINKGMFGARCSKTVYFQAGYEADSYSKATQTASDTTLEVASFKFGPSSSTSTQHTQQSSNDVKHAETQEECAGIVENNACTQHVNHAVSLQPTLMQAEPLPVWELQIGAVTPRVKSAFKDAVSDLVTSAAACGQSTCKGKGVCRRLSGEFWAKAGNGKWNGQIASSDFAPECICVNGTIAPDCRPAPVRKVHWVTPILFQSDKNSHAIQDLKIWHTIFVFQTGGCYPLATTVSHTEQDAPKIPCLETTDKTDVVKPSFHRRIWKSKNFGMPMVGFNFGFSLWQPVCPQGYVALSDATWFGKSDFDTRTDIEHQFWCVRESLTTVSRVYPQYMWSIGGSSPDASVWLIEGGSGTWVASPAYGKPAGRTAYILNVK